VVRERLEPVRSGTRKIALPSVGQEGVSDRVFRAAGERNEPHAPAGSAGGAPRIGVRSDGPLPPGLGL